MQQELYARVPEDKPLYNLRDVVPEIYQPRWATARSRVASRLPAALPFVLHGSASKFACALTGGPCCRPPQERAV